MKLKTKTFLFFLAAFLFVNTASAQLKIPGTANPEIRKALETVMTEFPKEFATIKGEVVSNNQQTVEYESLLSFKTAEKNFIVQHSGAHPIYSWHALMLTTEEFAAAEKKYKSFYSQLKNLELSINAEHRYTLSGEYDKPDESKKFSSTVFSVTSSTHLPPKLKVELSLQYELLEWKIYLIVYQKEREDNERGKIKEQ